MQQHTWLATALLLLVTFSATFVPFAPSACTAQDDDGLQALDGVWVYVEDRTKGRALEQLGPPMSAKFSMSVDKDKDAVILVSGHGSGHRDVRVALDGSATDVPGEKADTFARYNGEWKDGVFTYETRYVREAGQEPGGLIRRQFRMTDDGLWVRVTIGSSATYEAVAIYRHPEDIAMPTPAKATIDDLAWLSGAWVGTRGRTGATSIEERWSPPLGGALLGVSRTVSRGEMRSFEFLRIVERDGGLVYFAQPGGRSPTEFVLTELSTTRAVFDNPRHDYPKRIVYQLSDEDGLNVSIGFIKGGKPPRFEYKREGK